MSSTVAAGRSAMMSVAAGLSSAHSVQSRTPRFSSSEATTREPASSADRSWTRTSSGPEACICGPHRTSTLKASWSMSWSSRKIAPLERIDMSRNRIRRPSGPSPGRSTRMSRPAKAVRSASSAPGRDSPSRTKSPFGSKITTGSRVCMRICSSATPSAKVFPEPLCPHQKVCRFSRFGTSPTCTSGADTIDPRPRTAEASR